jgi:hypothetical protein
MSDPMVQNEIVKNLLEAYRVFSHEMQLVRMKKMDLVKTIIARLDAESIEDAKHNITTATYARRS